ncbi:cation:proton antiporter [Azospirillum sp. B506]|uniref:cation:proton antiporter domain-containing protein n=1 Tax=Azospirillum sp. B506 TaxID=137721 RepID=UPI0019027646|nr:cation:proton antiporter [Azospirillum sp. B506]
MGWLLGVSITRLIPRVGDAPTSVILQFVVTFGVWLLAERLGLSAVVTVVVFGLTAGRTVPLPARLRIPSFAVWEAVTFVLNVLAFTLIGLQLGPILETLNSKELMRLVGAALIILVVVIVVRLLWVMAYTMTQKKGPATDQKASGAMPPLSVKGGVVISWSGMRGIVTLAAALALPMSFPGRDFILLTAFVVVLGTLVVQGLTLRPLLVFLRLPKDNTVAMELSLARAAALKAAMAELDGDGTPAAERLRSMYKEALSKARHGHDPRESSDNTLRRRVVPVSRHAIAELRRSGTIGDDAYRLVEEELDWLELSSGPAHVGE